MKITDNFIMNVSHHMPTTKLTLSWLAKINGRAHEELHCIHSGVAKGSTSQTEATLNSEKSSL